MARPLGLVLEECVNTGGNCGLRVASLVPGGGAEASGMLVALDRLVAVGSRNVKFGTFDDVMTMLLGDPGTEINLTWERADAETVAAVAARSQSGARSRRGSTEDTRVGKTVNAVLPARQSSMGRGRDGSEGSEATPPPPSPPPPPPPPPGSGDAPSHRGGMGRGQEGGSADQPLTAEPTEDRRSEGGTKMARRLSEKIAAPPPPPPPG